MTGRERLLRCYPPAWRERYGNDLIAYLDDAYGARLPLGAVASLLSGGLQEWVRFARASRESLPATARVRNGVLWVLAGWAPFVVAGASFAKISEHFDASLSGGTRTVPDVAYLVVEAVATVCGLAVVAGVVLTLPAFVRFIAGGGWPMIRRRVIRATVATVLTAGTTVAVATWAHRLTAAQRNGGNGSYAALFLCWAGIVALTIGLWTVAAIAAARRLNLSRRLLLAEGAVASAVTMGMLIMLVAAAVWWAAIASAAPSFFGGATEVAAAWTPQLVATATLMVTALSAGVVGVARIARAVPAVVAGGLGRQAD